MLSGGVVQTIRAMPKIELHRHLEGSVRLETLVDIAQKFGIEMPEYNVDTLRPFVQMMPDEPRNLQHFFGKFQTLRQFYRSEAVIRQIVRESVIDAAADNIKYMELRFTPNTLRNIIHCSAGDIIGWVCDATEEAARACDIVVRLIASVNRHESVEDAEAVIQAAVDYAHKGVVAVDLAGRENGHPAAPFRALFREAKKAGLFITVHAGEWAGAESVWDAVGNLNADRIGHGIWAVQDPGVIAILLERDIVLEVCPTSNVDTGAVARIEAHPLLSLMRQGVATTLNTDDPLIFNLTLSDELARAVLTFGLSLNDIKDSVLRAARAAFLPPPEREWLLSKFLNWFSSE